MTTRRGATSWQADPVRRFLLLAVTLVLALTACSGSSSVKQPDLSPQERLAQAKRSLDAASYIGFTLTAAELPSYISGLLSASGTGTHAPAFTGKVKVQTGVDISAPLIALNGNVYAKLPFAGWSELNPADYGAPDPASLMDRRSGLSSLLPATTGLTTGDSQRSGDKVLTSITGTLPGSAVQHVFPSAATDSFTVDYTLAADNTLVGAKIVGPFYSGQPDVTYTIDLNLDADAVDINAPI